MSGMNAGPQMGLAGTGSDRGPDVLVGVISKPVGFHELIGTCVNLWLFPFHRRYDFLHLGSILSLQETPTSAVVYAYFSLTASCKYSVAKSHSSLPNLSVSRTCCGNRESWGPIPSRTTALATNSKQHLDAVALQRVASPLSIVRVSSRLTGWRFAYFFCLPHY